MDNLKNKLESIFKKNNTLLCIAPISKNCVDASIEISKKYDVPIVFIASRSQIETKTLFLGYVNYWTTESFSNYIFNENSSKNIFLARDHGGPWQNDHEKYLKLEYDEALNNIKKSFQADIDSGFTFLHIDPTFDLSETLTTSQVLTRVKELYEFCFNYAQKNDKDIDFEISIWEDGSSVKENDDVDFVINEVISFCELKRFPKPKFFVIPIGNNIKELKNTGPINFSSNLDEISLRISKMTQTCKKYGVFPKVHNADFLPPSSLKLFPKLGVSAVNIAPEIGSFETKSFLDLLKSHNLLDELSEFIEIAYSSEKWKKWVSSNSNLSKHDLAIIAGHYVFSTAEFSKLKLSVEEKLSMDIDIFLKNKIKDQIIALMKSFSLIS